MAKYSACADDLGPFHLRSSSRRDCVEPCTLSHAAPFPFPLPVARFGSIYYVWTIVLETATTITGARLIRFKAKNERLVCIGQFFHKCQLRHGADDFEKKFQGGHLHVRICRGRYRVLALGQIHDGHLDIWTVS